ncbi:MAG: leucine-rich repeat domain-containing protein, partial [Clostridia bacterium]|nr:leucine-rich repeat domain-containing protein [Clostridia bacterium]
MKMRRLLAFFLAALVILSTVPISVLAAEDKDYIIGETFSDDFTYNVIKGTISITGYNGGKTEIVIPSEIDGIPVTKIGKYAFTYAEPAIEKIIIPEGVTTLDSFAFARCEALKEISIPSTVTDIPERAFHMTTSLESMVFPNGNNIKTIGKYAFYKSSCGSAAISDKMEVIGNLAFYMCPIEEIVIPESVTEIGPSAFQECGLKKITLSENIKIIANSAFRQNDITELYIPDGVEEIGRYAFDNCDELITVTIGNDVKKIGDAAFIFCDKLTTVSIGYGAEIIDEDAFYWCKSLKKVVIPDTVTEIGDRAFGGTALEFVSLPASLNTLGDGAFANCASLSDVIMYKRPANCGTYVFKDCHPDLKIVYTGSGEVEPGVPDDDPDDIPDDVPDDVPENDGWYEYVGGGGLVINEGVTEIPAYAFVNHQEIVSVTIPESVT